MQCLPLQNYVSSTQYLKIVAYLTRNKLRLGNKAQPLNSVQGISRCYCENNNEHINTLCAERKVLIY